MMTKKKKNKYDTKAETSRRCIAGNQCEEMWRLPHPLPP